MPVKKDSYVYNFLRRVVENWDKIAIRVHQDGKWQSVYLCDIKEDRDIALWIISQLEK